jgi:hypothetical protein
MRFEAARAAATTLGAALLATVLGAGPPDLGGDWSLNTELSQDLVGKIKAATAGYEASRDGELARLRDDLLQLAQRGETVEIELGKDQVRWPMDDDVRTHLPRAPGSAWRAGSRSSCAGTASLVIEQRSRRARAPRPSRGRRLRWPMLRPSQALKAADGADRLRPDGARQNPDAPQSLGRKVGEELFTDLSMISWTSSGRGAWADTVPRQA